MKLDAYWPGKKTWGLLLSMLIITTYSVAQVSIAGSINDQDQSLTAATIALLALDSTLIAGVLSDCAGVFTLKGVRPGSYLISDIVLSTFKLDEETIALKEITVQADNYTWISGLTSSSLIRKAASHHPEIPYSKCLRNLPVLS